LTHRFDRHRDVEAGDGRCCDRWLDDPSVIVPTNPNGLPIAMALLAN
jgi:hypothetical protein